jgi:molybdopterin molybdotransferase
MTQPTKSLTEASCADDFDPNSMPVAKARELIRAYLTPISGIVRVPIRASLNRVLADDIISPVNVPAHRNSAMDGYAVRFADLKADGDTALTMVGTAFAGTQFAEAIQPGECVRVMTGATVPEGADSVVMQERVQVNGKNINIINGVKQGQNVRYAGEDLKLGEAALKKGALVRAAELGLIASLGFAEVSVYRPLRVAFFSTGDELKSVGSQLGDGEIYDSNRYTIFGMLTRMGCEVLDMGVVRDDPALLEATFIDAAKNADVVITSGGVSVGEADYTKIILTKLGEVVFWKIAMKPGRPLAYGKVGGAHFFGLPGNPVSVMVTFYQFVRDALQVLMGRENILPVPVLKARCTSAIKKAPGRTEFQRGILTQNNTGAWEVRVTGDQGSGILRSMSDANCFIILDDQTGNIAPGAEVEVQVMEGVV